MYARLWFKSTDVTNLFAQGQEVYTQTNEREAGDHNGRPPSMRSGRRRGFARKSSGTRLAESSSRRRHRAGHDQGGVCSLQTDSREHAVHGWEDGDCLDCGPGAAIGRGGRGSAATRLRVYMGTNITEQCSPTIQLVCFKDKKKVHADQ